MADEKLSLHIDDDWKKQAQEEKRKLAEQQKAAPAATAAATAPAASGASAGPAAGGAARTAARGRELPPPSFAGLIQSLTTQILYYLGDLSPRGGEESLNLDMAKHQIDTLGILEEKTKGNLTSEEQRLLDAALYETRMRYISVASQYT